MKLYVRRAGTVYGPLSVKRLQKLAASGQLKTTDKVRKDGDDQWFPASKVKGLRWGAQLPTVVAPEGKADTIDEAPEQAETMVGSPAPDEVTLDHTPDGDRTGLERVIDRVHLPGYEILGELGRGGMGVVYKARQLKLKRLVALKMILASPHSGQEEMARFQTEAEAVAQMAHPNIVHIYEVGEHEGLPFFSLEYVEGGSLEAALGRESMDDRDAAEIVLTLAKAMHSAHEKGIVHRDLKPANVLMTKDGELKISDFGLAKRVEVESGHTQTGAILGTPSYMAPEQASGDTRKMGPFTDVYALGAILYRLTTGRPPFQSENPLDTVLDVVNTDPVPPRRLNPKLPVDLDTICLKCLEKDPARRYASAEALAEDLNRFLQDEPIAARPAGSMYRVWRRVRRNRTTAMLSGAIVLLAIVGGLASWRFYRQSDKAVTEVAGVRKALQRAQEEAHIQQLAVIPFRNQSGTPDDDWIGPAFASNLETKLSGEASLRVISAGAVRTALKGLGIAPTSAIDDSFAQDLGARLVVDHVVIGDYQRLADQIQVSVKIINVATGVIDRGGLQVRGRFPNDVFSLQDGLATDCLAALGVEQPEEPARVQARMLVDRDPRAIDAWVLYGRGMHALQNREYDEAIRLLKDAVQKDSSLWMAYRSLGWAYHKSVRFEDAIDAFKKAVDIKPDDLASNAMYNLLSGRVTEGYALLDQAKDEGAEDLELFKAVASHRLRKPEISEINAAVKELEEAVQRYPQDHELFGLLAWAYEKARQDDRIVETLQTAVSLEPDDFEPHLRLFLHYDRLGRRAEAKREYELALQRKPEGARGFREFGLVFASYERPELAIEELERAVDLDPAHGFTYSLLGGAYAGMDMGRALEMFQKAFEYEPDSTIVISGLCRLSNVVQRDDLLLQYAQRWIKADPESYEAHQYLRIAYLKRNEPELASEQSKIIDRLTPTHATFFFWTGNALIQARQFDESVELLRRGNQQFPEDRGIEGLLYLAEGLQRIMAQQFEEAIPLVEKSGALMPDLPDVPMLLAQCYFFLQQRDAAVEQAKRVIELARRNFQARKVAYQLLERLGRADDAMEAIEKAIDESPTISYRHLLYVDLLAIHLQAGRGQAATDLVDQIAPASEDEWSMKLHLGRWLARKGQAAGVMNKPQSRQYLRDLIATTREGDPSRAALAESLVASLDTPQAWSLLGPFPGGPNYVGLERVLEPESSFQPAASYDGADGKVGWQKVSTRVGGYVDLARHCARQDQVVAYAHSIVESPRDQKIVFNLGSDDGVKTWLNQQLVFKREIYRRCIEGEDKFRVRLRQGPNELLLKVDQNIGDWGFTLDAVDERGWPADVMWGQPADGVD